MKKIFLLTVAAITLFCSSCYYNPASTGPTSPFQKNLHNIDLGMSKDDIIKSLGGDYKITYKGKDVLGKKTENITYQSSEFEEYHFHFVDDKLMEFSREIR